MTLLPHPMIRHSTRALPRARLRSRLARWAGVATLALGLAGCGASLIYERLDTLVGFYLEGLVTLDDAQSRQLSQTLSHNLDWHRRAELARYDASLRNLADAVADGSSRDELSAAVDRVEVYWRDIWVQAAPGYTDLALSLTEPQVRELMGNLARADEKEWREYAERTPAERKVRREKSLRKNIERFTGSLTAAQLALVHRYASRGDAFKPQWRENRRLWRAALEDTLRHRADTPQFRERMFQLIARPDDLWTPEYRRTIGESRAAFVDLLVSLDGTLSAAQRASVRKELLSLADDVRSLARRPG
jgi:hypothetical protein